MAACESESIDEFASYGEAALLDTAFGGACGALVASTYNPGNCFIAGTLVAAEAGNVPIEEVSAGDYVWAWDEETGDVALKQVVETYVNETEELIHQSRQWRRNYLHARTSLLFAGQGLDRGCSAPCW